MKKTSLALIFFATTMNVHAADGKAAAAPAMDCSIGPQERIVGQTKWLLYGCSDAEAAVLISAEGNPAFPFYFLVYREANSYRIYGEGAGNKQASGAALKDLEKLTGKELANMVREAGKPKR